MIPGLGWIPPSNSSRFYEPSKRCLDRPELGNCLHRRTKCKCCGEFRTSRDRRITRCKTLSHRFRWNRWSSTWRMPANRPAKSASQCRVMAGLRRPRALAVKAPCPRGFRQELTHCAFCATWVAAALSRDRVISMPNHFGMCLLLEKGERDGRLDF